MLTMRPNTRRRNPRTRKCFTMRHEDHPRASLDWVNMHMPIPIVRKNPCEWDVYIRVCVGKKKDCIRSSVVQTSSYEYAHTHTHTHMHIHIHTNTHAYTRAHTHTRAHTRTHHNARSTLLNT